MNTNTTQRVTVRLALEDGTIFEGTGFGACTASESSTGEVVFNTAMTGYQEALTDPSYAGQILVMTASMIGNYGVARDDVESDGPQVAGFVVRELARTPSNYRSEQSLDEWLRASGVVGLEGVDTRALVRTLRTAGALRGVLSADASLSDAALVERARNSPAMKGRNLAGEVSVRSSTTFDEGLGEWGVLHPSGGGVSNTSRFRVLALDCGGKRNIYRNLVERGCEVHLVPCSFSPDEIRDFNPDGLFVSNGPGDPDAVQETVATLREVAGVYPTFGICLGHQLLALAFGASTYKLKFGHRGANQPVRNVLTGRVEITSQNHGFCVDPASMPDALEVTHVHLNDGTVAGFRHRSEPVFSVQHHPEASPGPHDSSYLFDWFIELMRTRQPLEAGFMAEVQPA